MVNFKENYHFSRFQRGPTFSRGVQLFQLHIPSRNPYNLWFSRGGGVRTPCPTSVSALADTGFSFNMVKYANDLSFTIYALWILLNPLEIKGKPLKTYTSWFHTHIIITACYYISSGTNWQVYPFSGPTWILFFSFAYSWNINEHFKH